ncbi:unnamed protein product [Haemonchus placei]|uniref:Uncharacterized protein n=1 Tax=Haemonchus placei TaxID=6290 RepID=A0A0N4WWC7_HAEPC|nr:unnamed protein product [Haemonchus placei]
MRKRDNDFHIRKLPFFGTQIHLRSGDVLIKLLSSFNRR